MGPEFGNGVMCFLSCVRCVFLLMCACVCVCVYVCMREREKRRGRKGRGGEGRRGVVAKNNLQAETAIQI